MSKASKKASPEARADKPQKSVLAAAWAAVESGDVVTARTLAKAVIEGKKGPDDDAVAKSLAKALSAQDLNVGELPEQVAQAIVDRTTVPPRTYLYGAICLFVFLVLATLARARYGGA
ncbi:MAG: hypothetical protein MUC96_24315 [Myxococcaceae bacterium]|jgi:hypothetical protein|nr:hypothetical protein [Myxococcaceae bacterium]